MCKQPKALESGCIVYEPEVVVFFFQTQHSCYAKRQKRLEKEEKNNGEARKNPVTNELLWPIKHKRRVQFDLFKCLNLSPRPSFVSAMPERRVDTELSSKLSDVFTSSGKTCHLSCPPVSENCCPRKKNIEKPEKNQQGRRLTLSGPGSLQRARQVAAWPMNRFHHVYLIMQ